MSTYRKNQEDYYKQKLKEARDAKKSYHTFDDEYEEIPDDLIEDIESSGFIEEEEDDADIANLKQANITKAEDYLHKYRFDFPLEIFPAPIADHIRDAELCLNYPIPFYAAGILSAFSAAIGSNFKAQHVEGRTGFAQLMVVLIADPGANKTSPLKAALQPLEDYEKYLSATHNTRKKQGIDIDSNYPLPERVMAQDITMERLQTLVKNNPKGILLYNDEFAAFLKSMNKYRNGDDMEVWLQIFNGGAVRIDRMGRSEIITDFFTSVVGTTQTDVYLDFITKSPINNGFYDRLLPVCLDREYDARWSSKQLDVALRSRYHKTIMELLKLNPRLNDDGIVEAKFLRFTPEALTRLEKWQHKNVSQWKHLHNTTLAGFFRKLEIYIIRFALIIALMDYAFIAPALIGQPKFQMSINLRHLEKAILLATYFKSSAKRVVAMLPDNANEIKRMNSRLVQFHDALPSEFDSTKAIKVASKLGLSPRTVYNYLSSRWFKKTGHGLYEKLVYKS